MKENPPTVYHLCRRSEEEQGHKTVRLRDLQTAMEKYIKRVNHDFAHTLIKPDTLPRIKSTLETYRKSQLIRDKSPWVWELPVGVRPTDPRRGEPFASFFLFFLVNPKFVRVWDDEAKKAIDLTGLPSEER